MDMGHDHGNASTAAAKATCPMIMVFHGGHCERILWRGWVASTYVEFTFSCIALFLLALLYEALKFFRQQLLRRSARKATERMASEVQSKTAATHGACCTTITTAALPEIREKTFKQHLMSSDHIIQTLLNVIQIIVSYLLMLVFMNFNYWLCLSMILGLGAGYFLFGWIVHPTGTECCN